ncbi:MULTISPECIES: hypothetical protein [Burkholderia]|uniref:hypothetical protein n=1 Tax=Burkholderia TaxID=32008 RepID=UPI000B7A046A|nr:MULTISPECIES: hypothetical protein [Burkholderia]MBY4728004.1 hypothetical protein [Burkholderia contaminans]MCI3969227.1 hypothetical protein [Burkholderia sp. HI4860]OXI98458.1 hypothetical protein CFB48_23965 [Burkholderia sp. AU33647]
MTVIKELIVTRAAALKELRSAPARSSFYVRVSLEAPIEGQPGRVFPTPASARVSRAEAMRFVSEVFTDVLEARAARVPV